MIHFPFLTKFGPYNSQVASHPKGDRVVAVQPCWKWLQHLANQGWNGWTNRKMIYKWWVFRIFVSSQRQMVGVPSVFYLFMGFGGGLLTFLSTCSRHLCFVNIGLGLGGMLTFLSTCSRHLCFVNIGLGLGGMLTFLSTCSRHLCFVNIGLGLGGMLTFLSTCSRHLCFVNIGLGLGAC